MPYLCIAAAIFAVYGFRRYWLTPWGEYVSHSETKAGDVFMVVRHVRWYPPFLSYERTYHAKPKVYVWSDEKTGWIPPDQGSTWVNRQNQLNAMYVAAKGRLAETEELIK